MLKKALLVVAIVALAVSSIGCKTVQGVGEDIQNAGEATEKAIEN